ncbi:MAG: aspartate aminotransferase family protein [Candidatus Heimdallarchaeota archaeon]|nr:MAG: aspartate aminotransferase family protein [Candidatus Heimdallarchaeota archaeon]
MFNQILQTHSFEPILLEKAKGSWVWDVDGKKYLDCISGTWCTNLGHNHPRIIQAMKNQMEKLIHRSMWFLTPVTLEAAEKVLKFVPKNYDAVTFLQSGSEVVEYSINLAQKITQRRKILSLKDSYLGAFGLAKESSYHSGVASKLKIPYPICSASDCSCLDEHNELIDHISQKYVDELACFILEPIMVSGGILKPCKAFIEELCQRLQNAGVLVVSNEVTTGFGRSGKKFGFEHFDIRPDIVAIGKVMGNGYPVSAILTNNQLTDGLTPAEMYYAQSHQLDPLGAVVAKTVVEVFVEEQIIKKSQTKITQIRKIFESLSYPFIKEFRTHGMLFAISVQSHKNYSSKELLIKLKYELLKEGIIIGASIGKEILRLIPPLTITTNEIQILEEKINKVFNLVK